MGEITTVTKAATKTTSLRTTVPASIARQFNLKNRDKLDWSLRAEGGEMVIIVKPLMK